jgi:hypothetical protein
VRKRLRQLIRELQGEVLRGGELVADDAIEQQAAEADGEGEEISQHQAIEPAIQPELDAPESLPQEIVRAEVNFLALPFFALSRRDTTQRASTEYHASVRRGAQKLDVSWIVSSNPRYGYPGPFDRKVHKAIEQVISELAPPIVNPIRLGSLAHLAKLMGLSVAKNGAPSGRTYKQIKDCLRRITTVTVESKGTFYQKGKKRWLEDIFHLYDRVVFVGEEMDNGEVADTNYLFLNSWYLDNINARYVRPLDYTYYRSLSSSVASRLYELLGVKFYGMGRQPFIRYRYSTLCQLLPVTRHQHLSQAKRKLAVAHEELVRTGFFSNVEWTEVAGETSDWYVVYRPGPRAREELQGMPRQLELTPAEAQAAESGQMRQQEHPRPRQERHEDRGRQASGAGLDEGNPDWAQVLEILKGQITRPSFETWMKGTRLIRVEEEIAVVEAPNAFVAEMLERRMYSLLVSALREAMNNEALEVEMVVREG